MAYKDSNIGSYSESYVTLVNKFLFVFLLLIIYRVGTYIPLPGINVVSLHEVMQESSSGFIGVFNLFTGGALSRLSICSLNIMPYITASIMMQLMGLISENIAALRKEGEFGRKRLNQYTRYLTIFICLFQGYATALFAESLVSVSDKIVMNPGHFFRFTAVLSLIGGTMMVMWIGEQITTRGIGNGSSIVIFTGIVAGFPSGVVSLFEMGRNGVLTTFVILVIIAVVAVLIFVIIFVELSSRKLVVNYPKRQRGNKIYAGDSSHLPLKLNTANVIPPIFANSLLLLPVTLVNFIKSSGEVTPWQQWLTSNLSHGSLLYILLYIALICLFAFVYTFIVFNSEETADNLRKSGGIILGRRPGKHTSDYFDYILTRLTVVGGAYLSLICVVPEILISHYSIQMYLGGTSLLIIVNVVIDTFGHVQSHLMNDQYGALMNKMNYRKR